MTAFGIVSLCIILPALALLCAHKRFITRRNLADIALVQLCQLLEEHMDDDLYVQQYSTYRIESALAHNPKLAAQLQASVSNYNACVAAYNAYSNTLPGIIVSKIFGFNLMQEVSL